MKSLKITLILFVIVTAAAISIYVNRSSIFDYSTNKLIDELLPDYMEVENIDFDFENNYITLRNFKVSNPRGFRRTPFVKISKVNASFSQQDKKNILNGVIISNIVLFEPVIYFERLKDGETNIQQIAEGLRQSQKLRKFSLKAGLLAVLSYLVSPVKKVYDVDEIKLSLAKIVTNTDEMIEIKPVLNIKDGSLIFNDRFSYYKGYETSVEEISAKIILRLKEGLRGIDYVESEGTGFINGQTSQILHWITTYDPKASKLTMSNDFKIQNADLTHLHPYYDKFSPFVFEGGKASGNLIINFDNGVIGSMNEVRLSATKLEIKEGYPFKEFWAVSRQDLCRYFTSQSGEILFDFEINGPMEYPRFQLGPKTKMALTKLFIDKISDVLLEKTGEPQPEGTEGAPQKEKPFIQKIIDKYKELKKSD